MTKNRFFLVLLSALLVVIPQSGAVANPNKSAGKSNSVNSNAGNANAKENGPAAAPKKAEVESVSVFENTSKGGSNPENSGSANPNAGATGSGGSGKPEVANAEESKKPVVAQREVVAPGLFKNNKLVAGRFAAEDVNDEADQVIFSEADEKCGVEEEQTKVNATANSKAAATSNKVTTTSSKKPAANVVKTTTSKTTNSNAAAAKQKVADKKAEKEAEECIDYLVVFKSGTTISDIDKAAKGASGKVLKKFHSAVKAAIINGPPTKMAVLAEKNPNVRFVEMDGQVVSQGVQADAPWGLDRTDQRQLPLSGTYDDKDVTGFSIPVYVVDTGIYAAHQDFGGRVAAGFSSISDGRGSADCNGHGTHVAGTIGGNKYGVAKQSTLIPVRVLDCNGSGSYSGVIAGLDWIAANHPSGAPAVVNMSLGGAASNTLDAAVRGVISKGITVVVAAGNSNADACNASPARVKEAITVGASTNTDARASFSNFGSCVDLFAPGASITSAWISSTTSFAVASGTSMAAPHVAGVVARFFVANPTVQPFNTEASVVNSATQNVLSAIGTGSPNRLLFLELTVDTSTPPPAPSEDSGGGSTTTPGKSTAPGQAKKPKR